MRTGTDDEAVHDAFVRLQPRLAGVETPPAYLRATVVDLCLGVAQAHGHGPRATMTPPPGGEPHDFWPWD